MGVPAAVPSLAGPPPAWIADGGQAGALLGNSVAGAGDVNGDGYDDVIIGAHLYQNPSGNQGRALVYLGSAAGLALSPSWFAEGTDDDQGFGYCVAGAGDVNGDGYDDVIVGVSTNIFGGQARVYHGSPAGLEAAPGWSVYGTLSFGSAVAGAGDVNGDGYDDVIVGAHRQANGVGEEGMAFVYHGSTNGLSSTPAWTGEGNQLAGWYGMSVAGAGDLNGDGYSDIVVGAPYFSNGQSWEGRVFVYHGSATGLALAAAWSAEGNQVGARLGVSVGGGGDVNGDGYGDLVAGASDFSNGQSQEGRALVYLGAPGGLSALPAWTAESDQAGALLGASVAGAGDVDGDGFSDVIVGAYQLDNGEVGEGRAYVYPGSPAGLSTTPIWTAEGDQADAWFGASVAAAGDVDGSGRSAVLVGASQFHDPEYLEGRAYLYVTGVVGTPLPPRGAERLRLAVAPNPSAGVTELRYALPAAGRVRIAIQDVAGREVARLTDGLKEAGLHGARWDGLDARGARVAAGVYLVRLEFAGERMTRKIVRRR